MTSAYEDTRPDRLLIFDDDEAVGATLGLIARRLGLEVRLADQIETFLRHLDEWAPTHIALDLVMPKMDGIQVLRLLADRHCHSIIIITSGVGSRVLDAAQRSAEEYELNIAGVLPKPFMSATLRELLLKPSQGGARTLGSATTLPHSEEITEDRIRAALERREFKLAYQPKISCATGAVAGLEALVRWRDPNNGLIMPDQFIPHAESSGLIDELTLQICDTALRWMASFLAESDLTMSINVSVRNLNDVGLTDRFSGLCAELRINPARVILELTETSAMIDPAISLSVLTRLRMKGFRLSIDDFGTGYSSMLQLVRLPFSEIKVDKSFVMKATKSQEARTVVQSIVELGHSLGLTVTAEGVEDEETLRLIRRIGCDLAQGYHFARPMPGDQVLSYLKEHSIAPRDTPEARNIVENPPR